jgi:hypothetical protein
MIAAIAKRVGSDPVTTIGRTSAQGPGKVAVCAGWLNMPVAGSWRPAWINAVA